MNNGYIYKIENKINKKCYIGQTIQHYTRRWKEHINVSNNKTNKIYEHPLYRAFRKYGIDNFDFMVLEECEIEKLDEREIHWIAFYDSYNNGYNLTLGGGGIRIHSLDESEVIKKYEEFKSMEKVAELYDCSTSPIKAILLKNNINILTNEEVAQNYNHTTICKDDNGNVIREFKSIAEAAKWISGTKTRDEYRKTHATILRAILNGKKYFGYYWDSNFYSEDEKKRRTNVDLKKNREYYISNKNKKCPNCGKIILTSSNLCQNCSNKKLGEKAVKNKEKKYNVNRDILKQEIRTTSFLQLGKKYGVSDNAIRRWCKTYGLPYKRAAIDSYTDEEWEKL